MFQDLREILKNTGQGLALLENYKKEQNLRENQREALAAIIIDYELKDDLDKRYG